MKFVVRRAVAGLLLIPVVAVLYVAMYAVLVGAGAPPTTDISGAFSSGILFGLAFAVVFAFWTQIQKFADKAIA